MVEKINKSHVIFLLISFLIFNQFFNLYIFDIHVWRILNWFYTSCLVLYVLGVYLFYGFPKTLLRRWNFLFYFLGIVILSFIYVSFTTDQTLSETYRVSISWFQYLLVLYLYNRKYTIQELFVSLGIFSFIWFTAWIAGFLSPFPLYDASGEFDAEQLMSTGRGVVRLKIAGNDLMNLWGLWCLGIYASNNKKQYLLAYLLCLLFVILCVSRQHILFYSLIGFLYLLHKSALWRKIILVGFVFVLVSYIFPKTTIYQNLVELTEYQLEENEGANRDIRIQSAEFFLTDYPQNLYSFFFGHGMYHLNSDYGRRMSDIINLRGFILSDIGFVSIYFYYGMLGLCCFFALLIHVYKSKVPKEYDGIKLFIYFTFLANIFSHNIDVSMVSTAICLYVIYKGETKLLKI
jgi:hypothetical protein